MKLTISNIKKMYWLCGDCATEAGGKMPEGHVCTVIHGKCKFCSQERTLIPWVDFDWKDDVELDKVAKTNRD